MAKLKLTTIAAINALPFATKGQEHYWCTENKGFGLVVGTRSKMFVVQRDVNHKSVRVNLGRVGDIKLAEALRRADVEKGKLAKGINPQNERREAVAHGMTLRQAWELYKGHLAAKESSPKTVAEYEASLNRYCSDWLDRSMAEITREAAHKRHQHIGKENGKYAANATMVALRAIWNRARKQHPALPESPTVNVDFFKEKRRTAVVPYDKLPDWWAGVQRIQNPIRRDLYIWLLFTGTRSEEARSLRWEQVNLEAGTVHFPSTKTGAFTLPLSDFLIELLKQRKVCAYAIAGFGKGCEFVFPAEGSKGHIAEAKLNESEVGFFPCIWTPHTLRHSYVSMSENKVAISETHRRLLVNHAIPRSGDAHAGYNHPELSDLRRSQQAVTDAFRAAIAPV